MLHPSAILANRAWLRRSWPFPHIVARNVFKPDFYSALSRQMGEILGGGLSDVAARDRFSRNIPGYDAYGIGLDHTVPEPAAIFLSPGWRDLISDLFRITRTPYVFAGAHHHAIGSKNGFIHNDFNPVWFLRSSGSEIQIPRQELCAYKTGEGLAADADKVEVVRGAVVIIFLLNDGWQRGDGGETGLFESSQSCIAEPDVRCSPENNSLLAFECTPYSFHAFQRNRKLPRTSLIMWVHRPLEEATAKYGASRLERWKR
jgi:hypothetical protein